MSNCLSMTSWAEPKDVHEWRRRLLGARPVMLCLVVLLAGVSELRFDWIERALGAYLATTNAGRPRSGAIWDQGRQTRTAQQALEQIVIDRQDSRREAQEARTFEQIAQRLAPGQGAMLGPDRFCQLYRSLPDTVASEMISPVALLGVLSSGLWHRTYIERAPEGLAIYFLDADNRVLRQLELSDGQMLRAAHSEVAQPGDLSALPQFRGRIYGAAAFFEALATLPEEVQRGVLPRPAKLLDLPGRILRVGISDETVSEHIELAFELETPEGASVLSVQGQEWAVWRLRAALEAPDGPAVSVDDILGGWKSP